VAVLNKNSQNDLAYMPVATKQRDIGAGHLLHMRPTSIRSLRSMLHCWNSVIPTLFSLNLALKSTGSIAETWCWCRNCCQWSAALLEMWSLSSSKIMH